MKHPGGKASYLHISFSMPFPFFYGAGCIRICSDGTIEPLQLFLGQEDVYLAYLSGINIFILDSEFAAGDKRDKNKAERKKPQDFIQTLIPQIGSTLVLRLPLL